MLQKVIHSAKKRRSWAFCVSHDTPLKFSVAARISLPINFIFNRIAQRRKRNWRKRAEFGPQVASKIGAGKNRLSKEKGA